MLAKVFDVSVVPLISPPAGVLPVFDAVTDPSPYTDRLVYEDVKPFRSILKPLPLPVVSVLADTFNTKSVYVDGIELKEMLLAPPDPTVTDEIKVNVLGTFHPV